MHSPEGSNDAQRYALQVAIDSLDGELRAVDNIATFSALVDYQMGLTSKLAGAQQVELLKLREAYGLFGKPSDAPLSKRRRNSKNHPRKWVM
jgi:hypothetical protein